MVSDIHIKRLLRGFLAFLVLVVSACLPLKQMQMPLTPNMGHTLNAGVDAESRNVSDDYSESSEDSIPGDFGFATPVPPKLKWKKLSVSVVSRLAVSTAAARIFRSRAPALGFSDSRFFRPGYYLFLFRYTLF